MMTHNEIMHVCTYTNVNMIVELKYTSIPKLT
jgi:hypothetical protein